MTRLLKQDFFLKYLFYLIHPFFSACGTNCNGTYRACADSYFLSHCPHQCSTKEQAKKTYAGILKHSSVHGVRGEAKLDQQVVRPKKRLSFNFTHHQQRYDVHDHYEDVDSVAEVSTVFQDTLMPF